MTKNSQTEIVRLKKLILQAAYAAGEGHVASSFSILDILWNLYDQVMELDPIKKNELGRDVFVLSKGHASLGLYAVLAAKGFFNESEMLGFCRFESMLGGHPDGSKVPGVEASTGSLGHGFPMAVGIALGYKIQGLPGRVFALVGDGECNEGSIWEAVMLANQHALSNLCCIVDHNHSSDRALFLGDIGDKFRSFGWKSAGINGHDHGQIINALTMVHEGPRAVIAETIKGHGCRRMEGNPEWHHKAPNAAEMEELLKELGNA